MKLASVALFAVLALTGCATIQQLPIDDRAAQALTGQSIVITGREKPSFTAYTPGKALLGLIGAAMMVSAGNSIISENNVPDPADAIAAALAKAAADYKGARFVPVPVPVKSDDPGDIAAAAKGSGRFVIDVRTGMWSLIYLPTRWNHYRVTYMAVARLIDSESGQVMAEGLCKRIPEAADDAPTYEELLDGNAAELKKILADDGASCASELVQVLLPGASVPAHDLTLQSAQSNKVSTPTSLVAEAPGAVSLAEPASTRLVNLERRMPLEPGMFSGKTLTYLHPRDPSSFGTVSISFDTDKLLGMNAKSHAAGTWKIDDDILCAKFYSRDWANLCFYLVSNGDAGSGGGLTMVFMGTGLRAKASLK